MDFEEDGTPSSAPVQSTLESAILTAQRRAEGWRTTFIWFLCLGLIGAIILGVAASSRTTLTPGVFGGVETTHDLGLGIAVACGAAAAVLLTTLPLLAVSHLFEGQVEILKAQQRG